MAGCRSGSGNCAPRSANCWPRPRRRTPLKTRNYGADRRGDELPAELQRRETRLKKIRAAQRALEERARQSAEKAGKPRAEVQSAKPADKDQYNFTDPESRLMKGSEGLVQGYNAQAAVEPVWQLIVGQSVTPAANDKQQIEPMVQVIEQQSGQRPTGLLADRWLLLGEEPRVSGGSRSVGRPDRLLYR